ncbi:MAG TPA: GNAT family N-acetyltransferase [Verrucomicrobiae bacterium]|jgi:ribosomal protein S18 acetylase RimI-like enzyme
MQHPIDKVRIRQAAAADAAQLCKLLSLLFAQEADFKPDAKSQSRGLRLILDQPDVGLIYCATKGKSVIGMVSILFTVSTAEGGRAAWLEDMVVHPNWRGKSIGRQLLHEAINRMRSVGCARITLLTDSTNSAAIHFYEKAGFVRSGMIPLRLHL